VKCLQNQLQASVSKTFHTRNLLLQQNKPVHFENTAWEHARIDWLMQLILPMP
jgi:hypothetical protein